MTFRNHLSRSRSADAAVEAFLPGTGLGGCGVHWNGQAWRYHEEEFTYKTHIEQRYGKKILDPDLRIQDWGVTYQELEPYYDRFEYLLGVCGKAGNLKRQDRTGWKPFGSAPLARVSQSSDEGAILRGPVSEGGVGAGLSPVPAAIRQRDAPLYESRGNDFESLRLLRVLRTVWLRALRKGESADGDLAGAHEESQFSSCAPNRKFSGLTWTARGKKRRASVTWTRRGGNSSSRRAWCFDRVCAERRPHVAALRHWPTVRPATETGVVGRNYAYQTQSYVPTFLGEDVHLNSYMAGGASGTVIDDFSVDISITVRSDLSGDATCCAQHERASGRVSSHTARDAALGRKWKDAVRRHYNHTAIFNLSGTSTAMRGNYLDLDPTYRDAWGYRC